MTQKENSSVPEKASFQLLIVVRCFVKYIKQMIQKNPALADPKGSRANAKNMDPIISKKIGDLIFRIFERSLIFKSSCVFISKFFAS